MICIQDIMYPIVYLSGTYYSCRLFLPYCTKGKKVGRSNASNKAGSGPNGDETIMGSFLQLLSRCPSQKCLIPFKLTIFNRVRKHPMVRGGSLSWCFDVLWKSILSAPDRLANTNQQAITLAEKSMSRQWHKNIQVNYWEIN